MDFKKNFLAVLCCAVFTMSLSANSSEIINLDDVQKISLDKKKKVKVGSNG